MGSPSSPSEPGPIPRRRRRAALRAFVAVAVALIVAVAAYATVSYLHNAPPPGTTTLVVYTYSSLFGGSCSAPAFATVFGTFAASHHVHFDIECPAGTLSSTLIAQKASPRADLVIGLDEVTTPEAEAAHVLVPYASPELAHVPAALVTELSPAHAVTPYEYGYLGIDYSTPFAAATEGKVATSSFPDFAANHSWASALTVENPTTDITGEEFLLWQIAFYSSVLHENWTTWWTAVDPYLHTAPDWSTAFNAFNASTSAPVLVASYAADPAYASYNGFPGTFNVTLSTQLGVTYGWRAIYGLGMVAGSAHTTLDQEFIDWFLEGPVQSQIPTNEWEYPANATVALPSVYAAAPDPQGITELNPAIPPAVIPGELPGWLDEWQTLENTYG